MNLQDLPPELQKLATLDFTQEYGDAENYRSLGIGPQHIPLLIDITRHGPDFWGPEVSDEEYYVPMHAWRALAQMKAEEAVPALIDTLDWVGGEGGDLIQEELPQLFASFGKAPIPGLSAYLLNREKDQWGRIAAGEGLLGIAQKHPKSQPKIVETYVQVLERYQEEDAFFNAFIIDYLANLKAVDAAPLVEAAYQAGRVDETIIGDWEDFQVLAGMLKERITPRQPISPFQYMMGGMDDENLTLTTPYPFKAEAKSFRKMESKAKKKEKSKRKEAKTTRKKNRKKK